MPRAATGQLIENRRAGQLTFAIRFRAYGRREYLTLGTAAEGWTRQRAETELQNILADVRRGIWTPPVAQAAAEPRQVPSFHEFASDWYERQLLEGGRSGGGLSSAGQQDLRWRLSNHLLPAFAELRLDEITVEAVDQYRLAKVREGRLSANTINKTLATLAAILETAVEYELIPRNPARGKRRRLAATAPERTWLDRADHIEALLAGAEELDRRSRSKQPTRATLIATLIFAGLRIGEALALRWRDIDLERATLDVTEAKTPAGRRTVDLLPALQKRLAGLQASAHSDREAIVFATRTGSRQRRENVRKRILKPAIVLANERLRGAGAQPLPDGLTPHSMRRTFASLLFALGETPPYVMAQMGHTTPTLTLTIYARQMLRRDGEPERLSRLVTTPSPGSEAVEAQRTNQRVQ